MALVLSNWFDARLVRILSLTTDAGTIIYPLTFLLSDMITEVYGYKHARRAIWIGFLFNLLFVLYGLIVTHLPSPHFPTHNKQFDALFDMNVRIIFASLISYLSSEPCNSFIMAKLKLRTKGRFMGLRFLTSTMVSAGMDSMLFSLIAFYGLMSNHNLLGLVFTMWFIKVVIEALALPFSTRLACWLKRTDRLDIYDSDTSFTIFSLNDQYQQSNNHFQSKH